MKLSVFISGLAMAAVAALPVVAESPKAPGLAPSAALLSTVDFGDDSGPYTGDGECDDSRFIGWGVATSTDSTNNGTDAGDCRHLFEIGQLRVNRTQAEFPAEMCAQVNFGDDSGDFSNDNECDDPRFTGSAMHNILNFSDLGRDASDCQALCESGAIWLR
ncbi:hypothetical protein [Halocynthiibacter sp.]|uniref:hypothetical protein n=1 Tax=Halocynthiibacter sp. TaxID=1979210 RepID=UPI003C68B4CA